MHGQRFKSVVAAASLSAAVLGYIAVNPAGADRPSSRGQSTPAQGSGANPNAINCRKTFTSGTGPQRFSWCFSDAGNIVSLQGPGTTDHIRIGTFLEGYALCVGANTEAYDNGNAGAGFGAPSYPNATTVVRNTPNFRVTQQYLQDTREKWAIVNMTVANLTSATFANVRLSRFVDFDIDGTPANDRVDRSASTVWAAETNAVALTARSFSRPTAITVESFGDLLNDTGCDATTPLATPFTGDGAERLTYSLGTIGAHASIGVTFRYERL